MKTTVKPYNVYGTVINDVVPDDLLLQLAVTDSIEQIPVLNQSGQGHIVPVPVFRTHRVVSERVISWGRPDYKRIVRPARFSKKPLKGHIFAAGYVIGDGSDSTTASIWNSSNAQLFMAAMNEICGGAEFFLQPSPRTTATRHDFHTAITGPLTVVTAVNFGATSVTTGNAMGSIAGTVDYCIIARGVCQYSSDNDNDTQKITSRLPAGTSYVVVDPNESEVTDTESMAEYFSVVNAKMRALDAKVQQLLPNEKVQVGI